MPLVQLGSRDCLHLFDMFLSATSGVCSCLYWSYSCSSFQIAKITKIYNFNFHFDTFTSFQFCFFPRFIFTLLSYKLAFTRKNSLWYTMLTKTETLVFVVQVGMVSATDPDQGRNGMVTYSIDNSSACPLKIREGESQWFFSDLSLLHYNNCYHYHWY